MLLQYMIGRHPDWLMDADGVLVREEQYINPLKKNSLGPREALCIDQQQCRHRSSQGFVVDRKVFTPKVCTLPYIRPLFVK